MTGPTLLPLIGEDLPDEAYEAVLAQLRTRRQFDLESYKDRCIRRRIAKRMRASGADSLAGYLALLAGDNGEVDALLATLSIHVSQFFRNPDTFQALERQVLPGLCSLVRAAGRRELRLWSAGCAGGEEPYSLALLMDELAPPGLQVSILATDVSEEILAEARTGLFEAARLQEVPKAVRERYFTAEGDRFRLAGRICERVRFVQHNLTSGEAYPPADLILCRNVLIYFTREEQSRILSRFAAALPEGGALVLGRAETLVGPERRLFAAAFPTERIYRRGAEPVA